MLDPRSTPYRYTVLLCCCFLIFGNYFVYDLPGALTQTIKDNIPDPLNPGQPMQQSTLNLLYSVYNFPNIVLAMLGGVFVDRLGLRTGCFVFVTIILAGQCVVALGATVKNFWIMLVGRVIFAVGGEACAVAQNAFVSRWFRGKELALALGLALSLGRLGSGLNFLSSASIAGAFGSSGLSIAMWFGVVLCGISELSCFILILLDRRAEKMGVLGDEEVEPEQISLQAVKDFPAQFWLICAIVVVFYSAVFPFNAMAVSLLSGSDTNYINLTTKQPLYDETTAGYIVSIPSFLAVFLAPMLGRLVDVLGRRPLLVGISSILLGTSHLLFALTYSYWADMSDWLRIVLHPVVLIMIFGVAYGLLAAALFPCVPLVIEQMSFIGTAFGIVFSLQNGGLAAITYIMGVVQDKKGHVAVELCMAGFAAGSLLFTIALYVVDARNGYILSKISKAKPKGHEELLEEDVEEFTKILDDRDSINVRGGPSTGSRKSRTSYDFTDLPAASDMIHTTHTNVRNSYLSKIGIVGMEGRMRGIA